MTQDTITLAQLEVRDCAAELWLNDIPLVRLAPHAIPIQNTTAESFLVPGDNTLEVVVEPGPRPSLARAAHDLPFRELQAIARLIRFPPGVPGTLEHGELLAETRFTWSSPDPQPFPRTASVRVDMGDAHGRFRWQDAPALTLDAATVTEARLVLDEVEAAIRASDERWLWHLNELKFRDAVRSFAAMDEAYVRGQVASHLEAQRRVPDPIFARDPERHDFRLVAHGRMIQCVDVDGSTSFKLRAADGQPLPYMLFLARIDGRLRIVR